MSVVFEEHVLRVKVIHGTCSFTKWHWGHETPSFFVGVGTYVRNDSESASDP